jgi:branched-subunit amino acid ABC-type transport system permease component
LEILLKKAFGRTLEKDDSSDGYLRGYQSGALKKLNEDSLNIFGYKAAKSVIVTFCLLVVLASYVAFNSSEIGEYLECVSQNNFLLGIHGLALVWFLDTVIPNLLFRLLNGLIWLR